MFGRKYIFQNKYIFHAFVNVEEVKVFVQFFRKQELSSVVRVTIEPMEKYLV